MACPPWARDHKGQMDDGTAKNAVIEELREALASAPAPAPAPTEGMLYEHEDGRHAVSFTVPAPFSDGDPKWHRVGPVTVHGDRAARPAQDDRAAFEAEMRCEETWGHKNLKRDKHGHYLNSWTGAMWEVWQAARAVPSPAVTHGRTE